MADAAAVPSAVAAALGLERDVGGDPARALPDLLAGWGGGRPSGATRRAARLLLVLDNFEQVQDAAPFVADLLAAAPDASVLVTSRSPLHLAAEHEYPVPPLPLPDPAGPHGLETLDRSGAVRLFVQRAQAARPDFRLTAENAPAVAEICRLLDGLPLALELAPARIKLLPPQALLDRLRPPSSPRPALRSRGPAPPRPPGPPHGRSPRPPRAPADPAPHPGLEPRPAGPARAAPLRPPRRLRRGLHPGGRHRGLRRSRTAYRPQSPSTSSASLVDESLLRQEERPAGAEALRFQMLETVREYAAERLEQSGEGPAVRRAHAAHYLALAEQAEPELRGPQQDAWLLRLGAEDENLRAALRAALAEKDATTALRLGGALWWYWYLRGLQREGRGWLRAALSLSAGAPSLPLQPRPA